MSATKAILCLGLGVADLVALNVFLVPAAVAEMSSGDTEAPADDPDSAEDEDAPAVAQGEQGDDAEDADAPRDEDDGAKDEKVAAPADEEDRAGDEDDDDKDAKVAAATIDKADEAPAAPDPAPVTEPEPPPPEPEPAPAPAAKRKKPPKPQRVFFKTASSKLPYKYRRRIKWLAKKDSGNFKYIVTGAADYRGSKSYNDRLGKKRADSVRKALTKLGVDPDRIETESVGEEKARKRRIWRDRKVTVEVVEDEP